MLNQLSDKHGYDLNEKSLTICSGLDMVNINYLHVVCPSAEVAKVSTASSSLDSEAWGFFAIPKLNNDALAVPGRCGTLSISDEDVDDKY